MPNDAKLGFLVGVAGVIAAAVMFSQKPPPTPAEGTAPEVTAASSPPPLAATPMQKPRSPASPAIARQREELQGHPASRTDADE